MAYKAENIDTDKFLEQLKFMEDLDFSTEYRQKQEVIKYHEGFRDALYRVRDMFYCCNYEKKEKTTSNTNNNTII